MALYLADRIQIDAPSPNQRLRHCAINPLASIAAIGDRNQSTVPFGEHS